MGQRHNITVDENGALVVTLMLDERYVPIVFVDEDFDMPTSELIANMVALIKRYQHGFEPDPNDANLGEAAPTTGE